jgi:hypothetical protein
MFLTPLETDNKQILRRGVYPEHRRRAPQNDIATSPQGDGRQAYNPNFRRRIFPRAVVARLFLIDLF